MMFQLNLRQRGISDQAVLKGDGRRPRELFVTSADRAYAYRDTALGIACGQTISQPFVVAYMTEQLDVRPEHRVLEIGTGSGYQAAILSKLCREVVDAGAVSHARRPRRACPRGAWLQQCGRDPRGTASTCPRRSAPSTGSW